MILECYSLLKVIEHRPAMWSGEVTLQSIRSYVSGYYHALIDNNIVQPSNLVDPFFHWVAERLGYYESTAGWANMILAHCTGCNPNDINWEEFLATPVTKEQHLKSVNLFYELVEQYKSESEVEN